MRPARLQLYREAGEIAYRAMGTDRERWGRGVRTTRRADDDPLACWELTELIVALADRWRQGMLSE
jgi:hypothetical protein